MSLPSGYTQLEYIESHGTEYFDTGFVPDGDSHVVVDFEVATGSFGTLFGARVTSSTNAFAIWVDTTVNDSYQAFPQYGNVVYNTKPIAINVGQKLTYELNKGVATVGGTTQTFTNQTFSAGCNLALFAINTNGVVDDRRTTGKLYSAKVYDNGTLIRDYIPCLNASGTVGLWDDVNGVFYSNAGSGTFDYHISKKHKTRIDSTGYETKSGRVLIDGTGYSIKKGRTLIDGTGYDIKFATPLGELDEGTLVKLNEDGSPVEFYIAKHDYESGLNGTGRTLMVRKDCYSQRKYHSSATYFPSTDIYDWLNDDYYNLLDANVRTDIGTTKYKYFANFYGTSTTAYGTNTSAVFLMSMAELFGTSEFSDGSQLPIADVLKIAYFEGSATAQWTRSSPTQTNAQRVNYVAANGTQASYNPPSVNYVGARPIFTLPSDVEFDSEFMLVG